MGPPANNQRCEWNRVWCSKLTRLLRGGHSRFSRLDSYGNCQNHEGKRNHHRLAHCRRRHFSANTKQKKAVFRPIVCFVSNVRKFDFCQQKFTGFSLVFFFMRVFSFDYWHASSALSGALQIFDIHDRLILPTAVSQQYLYLSLFLFAPICQYETIGDVGLFLFFFFSFFFMLQVDRLQDDAITPDEVRQSRSRRGTNGACACFKSQIIDEQIWSLKDGNQTSGNLSCQFAGVT